MTLAIHRAALILKAVTVLWALLTLGISAGLLASLNSYYYGYRYGSINFAGANALIAAAVFAMIWFILTLVLQFKQHESILNSMILDTVVIGITFLIALGGAGSASSVAGVWGFFDSDKINGLGNAMLAFGWLFVFLLLAILLLQVIVTLKHHGGSLETWKTPFYVLLDQVTSHSQSNSGNNNTTTTPMTSFGGPSQTYRQQEVQPQVNSNPYASGGQQQQQQQQQQEPLMERSRSRESGQYVNPHDQYQERDNYGRGRDNNV